MNMDFDEFKRLREMKEFPRNNNTTDKDDFELFMAHYEEWNDYFKKIFLNNYTPNRMITLVFWESGPGPDNGESPLKTPKKSYAFNNRLNPLSDSKYLKAVCKRAEIFDDAVQDDKNHFYVGNGSSKDYALTLLSKKNWLIVDLYPTHGKKIKNRVGLSGIKKNSTDKEKLTKKSPAGTKEDIFTFYTKKHLESIFSSFKKEGALCIKFNNEIHYLDFLIDTIGRIIKDKVWFEKQTKLKMNKIKWEGYR